jgi:parvulin-like peptidyl-prolyl isomerase
VKKITLLFFITIFATTCSREKTPAEYIAHVNNVYLTKEDLLKAIPDVDNKNLTDSDYIKSLVTTWVKNEILYQQAKKYHFDKDETITFRVENFEKQLIIDAYVHFLLQSNVRVSDAEIRNFYLNNRNSFRRDVDEAKVSHIVISDFEEANRIKNILRTRNRRDIDQLFNQYNFETKVVRRNESIKEIDKTIFESPRRNVLGPIPSDYGYHIIEVISRARAGSIKPIDDVRDEILQKLTRSKIQEYYNSYVDSLISITDYEIKSENLQNWNITP